MPKKVFIIEDFEKNIKLYKAIFKIIPDVELIIESNEDVFIIEANSKKNKIQEIAKRLSFTYFIDKFLFSSHGAFSPLITGGYLRNINLDKLSKNHTHFAD